MLSFDDLSSSTSVAAEKMKRNGKYMRVQHTSVQSYILYKGEAQGSHQQGGSSSHKKTNRVDAGDCRVGNGGCEHICERGGINGAVKCSCRPGFELHFNGFNCLGKSPQNISSFFAKAASYTRDCRRIQLAKMRPYFHKFCLNLTEL